MTDYTIIYKLFWLDCPYFYIGQTKNYTERFNKHCSRLKSSTHENQRLQNVFNKYGLPECQIIDTIQGNFGTALEQFYIDFNFSNELCCNLSPTANTTLGYKHSTETLKKIGELSKKKVYTEEYRLKLSEAQKRRAKSDKRYIGRPATLEIREKMSRSRTGVKKSDEHKRKISESNIKTRALKRLSSTGSLSTNEA